MIGGDFNDIWKHKEKMGGRRRSDSSFESFRSFIAGMGMGEVKFRRALFICANNRENEGFIQERLDRFFGTASWMLHWPNAKIKHVARQASDNFLLVLDTEPQRDKTRSRFIFNSR